ncbi:RASGEF1B isoform 12 [Pan troglodytes]|uniref:RASGEF1B isoform 12 n=1 Tax=Pan troglodytes TaxID=9598 RepID=A0A2J8PG34_PANTR|nr:RASGEF1B isoform 12 [Pan troglodytes]
MAKFLAELLGCTLPSKGASPMFESKSHSRVGLKSSTKQKTTIFSTLASEKSLSDCKKRLCSLSRGVSQWAEEA